MAPRSPKKPRAPAVGIIMGSQSDWTTLKVAADILDQLKVAHETRIVSAHRTPDRMTAIRQGSGRRAGSR